jgi:cardiolipin synthase
MTIPNLITSVRIILAPIFIIYLINDKFSSALIVFILAGLSDGADGLIARVFNQKSSIGTYLDPLADKILLVTGFIVLSVMGFIPSWLTVVAISRDVLILLGILILFLNDKDIIIKPSVISKFTTCFQLATIFVVLSKDYIPYLIDYKTYIFWITGILTISSGLHYMRNWFRLMGETNQES